MHAARSTNIPHASARSVASISTAISKSKSGRTFDRDELEAACNARWRELVKDQPLLPGIAAIVSTAKASRSEDRGGVELHQAMGDAGA